MVNAILRLRNAATLKPGHVWLVRAWIRTPFAVIFADKPGADKKLTFSLLFSIFTEACSG